MQLHQQCLKPKILRSPSTLLFPAQPICNLRKSPLCQISPELAAFSTLPLHLAGPSPSIAWLLADPGGSPCSSDACPTWPLHPRWHRLHGVASLLRISRSLHVTQSHAFKSPVLSTPSSPDQVFGLQMSAHLLRRPALTSGCKITAPPL